MSDATLSKSQIDFVLVKKKWINSIKNAEALNLYDSIGSDHRVVVATVKLSLRAKKEDKFLVKRYDWTHIKDKEVAKKYARTVKDTYKTFLEDPNVDKCNATEKYQKFIDSHVVAANELIPMKKKTTKVRFENSDAVQASRKLLQAAKEQLRKYQSSESKDEYKKAKENLRQAYERENRNNAKEIIENIDKSECDKDPKLAWNLIRQLNGDRPKHQIRIKATDNEERLHKWQEYLSDLLNAGDNNTSGDDKEEDNEKVVPNERIDDGPFSRDEYEKVIKTLKLNKAAGEDMICAEILKNLDFHEEILEFCKDIHLKGMKPNQLSMSNIIPIPKKGDLSMPSNYKGIAITSLVSKILNKMIYNRIQPHIDPILRVNQIGARAGRSTAPLILGIRRIIKNIEEFNLNAVLTFIDFRKAYDSINRGKMLDILRKYGIPRRRLKTIAKMYEETWAKVCTRDGKTGEFRINSGILQGDTLAPYIFIICIDYCMNQALRGAQEEIGLLLERGCGKRFPPKVVTDFDFVDDLCLFTRNIQNAQKFLSKV